eukprot:m.178311 g.178311  ORF g.178311 m.178311 type:complete len:63 (+) comp16589_c0_seq2:3463-3651(+)
MQAMATYATLQFQLLERRRQCFRRHPHGVEPQLDTFLQRLTPSKEQLKMEQMAFVFPRPQQT